MIAPEENRVDLSVSGSGLLDSVILVSTSEIVLKSPYVRSSLLRTLLEHLRWTLKRAGFQDFKVTIDAGRIVVSGVSDSRAAKICSHVFGVAATASAIRLPSEPSTVVEEVSKHAESFLSKDDSFAVRVRIIGPYPIPSKRIERDVGSAILARVGNNGVTVDLDHPKKTIHVEIRSDSSYLYERRIEGSGGLPYGCQGRLVGLLSEDIDGAVASWLMMKRGSHVIPLFMETISGKRGDGRQKTVDMARKLRDFAPVNEYRLVVASFPEMTRSISFMEQDCEWAVHRRMMYRIACSVAERLRALGIVTGERFDTGSRTLVDLPTISEAAWLPVHRPLIGLDETEVADLARRIGVCQVSAQEERNAKTGRRETVLDDLRKIRAIEEDLHADLLVQNALRKIRKIDL